MCHNLIEKAKSEYALNGFESILIDLNGAPLPFDKSHKRIAIAVSGGADSAILAYSLCHLIMLHKTNTEVHIISNIRNWKSKPWQHYNSITVYNYLVNKFSNIKFYRHENFVPPEFEWGSVGPNIKDEYGNMQSGDIIELRAYSEYIVHTHNIDSWYVAVTKNPNGISDDAGMKNRSITDISINNILLKRGSVLLCKPFLYLEKDYIIGLYKYFNVLDLLDITRSCEGEIKDINYKTYTLGDVVPICKTCFWCRERQWGIDNAK